MLNTIRSATNREGQAGYSIIEILVVVMIMGIMVLVGAPTMEAWMERYRVRSVWKGG